MVGDTYERNHQTGPQCSRACPPGSFCAEATSQPQLCREGTYCTRGSPSEVVCPTGTHSTTVGATSSDACVPCPAGSYCRFGHAIQCSPSTFNPLVGAANDSSCVRCPPHTTTTDAGASSAEQCRCASGRVPLAGGRCGCPRNQFYSRQQDICSACPERTGSPAGADQCTVCREGFYLHDEERTASSDACEPVLLGMQPSWNTTVRTAILQPGFWRLSARTTDIRRCDGTANSSGCGGGTTSGGCRTGQTGPRCTVCTDREEFYDTAAKTGVCSRCPNWWMQAPLPRPNLDANRGAARSP